MNMEPELFIPYSRQLIDADDIKSVLSALSAPMLTTGPLVEKFESAVACFVGSRYAVAVSSGTAALHAAMFAIGLEPGNEVIIPALTFVATANAVVYQGGVPVFVDIRDKDLLINPELIEPLINKNTKAIVAVDYAGHPCDYSALKEIAERHGLILIADACHSLGAEYKSVRCGSIADLTIFSFHPVKAITTAEGGMITTDDQEFANKLRKFRNHGFAGDYKQREESGSIFYEMTDLGFNYRIPDILCALGLSQLKKLPIWLEKKRELAEKYKTLFSSFPAVSPLPVGKEIAHSFHLYVVKVPEGKQTELYWHLRNQGVGVNVHYKPVHLQPFYKQKFATKEGLCPVAEKNYLEVLSLPMFSDMRSEDIDRVVELLKLCLC